MCLLLIACMHACINYSVAVSSDNKELYAGYSNQQIIAWVKPKHSPANFADEGEYEYQGLDNYYSKFTRM